MALAEIARDGTRLPVPSAAPDALKFTFFVPCYNEEENVINVIEKLVVAAGLIGASHEILVFDDCSRDRTVDLVRGYQQTHPGVALRLFVNSSNQGVARNFIEGAFQGRGKYYRVIMGDDVESVETLTAILGKAGQADIIIPYHSHVTGRAWHRKAISRLYTVLVNIASRRKLRYYNGSPLFLRRDAMRFHVEATGLGFQAEFLLRLLQEGRSFIEIAVVANDGGGSTSLNLRNFISVGYSIFNIFRRRISGKQSG